VLLYTLTVTARTNTQYSNVTKLSVTSVACCTEFDRTTCDVPLHTECTNRSTNNFSCLLIQPKCLGRLDFWYFSNVSYSKREIGVSETACLLIWDAAKYLCTVCIQGDDHCAGRVCLARFGGNVRIGRTRNILPCRSLTETCPSATTDWLKTWGISSSV
jgi:hypothetical protein